MSPPQKGSPAFVFDIDGVLVKSKTPLPHATETMAALKALSIPFIFLTNGGGLTEEAHAQRLSSRLGVPIDARQMVQSHTPFRDLVGTLADKPILVLGGSVDQVRDVAHAYGFELVITTADAFVEDPTIHPFPEMTASSLNQYGRHWKDIGLSSPIKETPIAAILVWTSPRDWCLDMQIVMDLMLSKDGIIGTRSSKNGSSSSQSMNGEPLTNDRGGYLQDNQPALFFCNPDITWATEADHPRLAQGAFKAALEGLWHRETGGIAGELPSTTCGKPTELTYVYGEEALRRWAECERGSGTEEASSNNNISNVYMIGDNPASDIQGANGFVSRQGYI